MIPLIIRVLVFLLVPVIIFAQDKPEYRASLIPDSLKKNAHSVIREQVVNTEIGREITIKTRSVITALDESGADDLDFAAFEDKFNKLDFAEVRVFDAAGNQLKKYKKKEMEKVAYDDRMSVAVDGKVYYLDVPSFSTPFTVEIISETTRKGYTDISDFYPALYDQAIQVSVHTVTSTANNKLRYKNRKTDVQPVVSENGGVITWQWKVEQVKALQYEKGSPRGNLPAVLITPTYFEMDDYAGDFMSWQRFGEWYWKLSEGAANLTPEKAAFFRDMVKDIPDTEGKIKKLYHFLQNNYRYVSIQLGIGGFKPFDAMYVEKNKFGDCKALSNFMQTILGAVGIKSHQALINAGSNENPVDPDFANNPFNHVILCVPGKDSIWLECTSRDAPFGQLGSFTENRYALLITENGGKLVPTPRSRAADNLLTGKSHVALQPDGSAQATVEMKHTGSVHEMMRDDFWEQPEHKQKEFLVRHQGFKDYDQIGFEKETVANMGITRLNLHFSKLPDFSAGSKHFLRPHLYTVWSRELPEEEKGRTNEYVLGTIFVETDTTVWQLPDGYIAENLPASVSFSCSVSSFEAQYKTDAAAKTITAICRFELKQGRVPASQYAEARLYFQRVVKELEQKIIIKRG